MKTVAVNIENLCAKCHSACRHCLLNSQHKITGVDYHRGEAFAKKFYSWLKENKPDLGGMYYVGYSMDFPELPQYADYFVEQTGMHHLMFDGMGFCSDAAMKVLLERLQAAGISQLHFTFYGTENDHDRFAGRTGDFDNMMRTASIAKTLGMSASAGIMVTEENAEQIDGLYRNLFDKGISPLSLLLPHGKGRGYRLSEHRLTKETLKQLPEYIQDKFPDSRYKTEADWLTIGTFPSPKERHLTLSLTPENVDRLENMQPADIISELEAMDEVFYKRIPDVYTLAAQYGRKDNTQLFRFRDLYLQWMKRYLEENPIRPDMTDERYSFSTRIFEE